MTASSSVMSPEMLDQTASALKVLVVDSAGDAGYTPTEADYPTATGGSLDVYQEAASSVETTPWTEAYAAGTAGLGARILIADNTDTSYMYISMDAGTTVHIIVNPGKSLVLDLGANGLEIASAIHVRRFAAAGAGSYTLQLIR